MSDGKSSAAASAALPELILTRVLDAPRSLVFKVWTDEAHLTEWWGPKGFTNPVCKIDVRPGGAIRIDMRAPDGVVYPMGGEFREIVEPERLVFTTTAMPDNDGEPQLESLVTITFAEEDGKTKLTVHVRVTKAGPGTAPCLAGMEIGWTQTLEKLGDFVALARKNAWSGAAVGPVVSADGVAAKSGEREIVGTRVYDAPRELVYEAWTTPEHVAQWWGPRGFTTTIQEMDVRAGGAWRLIMHGPDGTDYRNKMVYLEVVKPERIVYEHEPEMGTEVMSFRVTVTFAEEGNKTKVAWRMVFPSTVMLEHVVKNYHAVEGLAQTMARLAEYVERG